MSAFSGFERQFARSTDPPVNTNVTIDIFTGTDARAAVMAAVRTVFGAIPGHRPLLVPSTGNRGDTLLGIIEHELRAHDVVPGSCVPANGPRALVRQGWAPVEIVAPDLPFRRVRISNELVGAEPWVVCDVDAVARTGPFVLDVFSRHLHPVDRLLLLADRQRERRAADLNLTIRPAWSVIGGHAGAGYLLATTRDPVAAELVALALSEGVVGPDVAFTGPWEDPVVQRATELELGVIVPHQIRLAVHGDPGDAWATLERIAGRIGVDFRAEA